MVEEIEEDRFGDKIEKNNRIKIRIQELAVVKEHWSDCAKKEQGFEHYADKKEQEFDIHVASILWEKKKGDNGNNAINHVETRHEETMQEVGD